ncbi:MAG: hypothetical protein ACTSR8_02685 [Promethearchaeota archaeon]
MSKGKKIIRRKGKEIMGKGLKKVFEIKEFIKYSVKDLMEIQVLDKIQSKLMKNILYMEFLGQ